MRADKNMRVFTTLGFYFIRITLTMALNFCQQKNITRINAVLVVFMINGIYKDQKVHILGVQTDWLYKIWRQKQKRSSMRAWIWSGNCGWFFIPAWLIAIAGNILFKFLTLFAHAWKADVSDCEKTIAQFMLPYRSKTIKIMWEVNFFDRFWTSNQKNFVFNRFLRILPFLSSLIGACRFG